MANFTFLPAGAPISTSFAVSASTALSVSSYPTTASFAGFASTNYGPTGSRAVTASFQLGTATVVDV